MIISKDQGHLSLDQPIRQNAELDLPGWQNPTEEKIIIFKKLPFIFMEETDAEGLPNDLQR